MVLIFVLIIYLSQKYGDGGNDDWENYDRNGKHKNKRRSSAIPWIFLAGSRGGFGGGSFGAGGGSFGGFGGGGFSGGGAGGSW